LKSIEKHLINTKISVRETLSKLNELAADAILFIVDDHQKLIGSLTDGDVRRGLIKGLGLEDDITSFIQNRPKFFRKGSFDFEQLEKLRSNNFKIIPVLDDDGRVVDIINFRFQKSYLPIDAVIMAGGMGKRLMPLTANTPKPLLKVNNKPIVEYNIDRLKDFGVRNITLSVKYLGEQIEDYFGNGSNKALNINYVREIEPLGTIGAVNLIEEFKNDYVLVMNSDLLTNINFEDMFRDLITQQADMVVATIPYEVEIPYGIIETDGNKIIALKEKPTYTYYSNAGIYIFKKEHVNVIPKDQHFNATELIETLFSSNKKVIHHTIIGYWLDIGKHHDFEKAQIDVGKIEF